MGKHWTFTARRCCALTADRWHSKSTERSKIGSWTWEESTMSPRHTNRLFFRNPKLAQKAYEKSDKRGAAESN